MLHLGRHNWGGYKTPVLLITFTCFVKGRLVDTKSVLICGAVAAAGVFSLASPAQAVTLYSSLPSWETTVGSHAETTSFGAADGVPVTVHEQIFQLGSSWTAWSGGYAAPSRAPEPFAWILMLGGYGAAGIAMRRHGGSGRGGAV